MIRRTNNLLRKSPTSPVVEGPPIFIKTIAVGPLDEVASCVTGWTTVAMLRFAGVICTVRRHVLEGAASWRSEVGEACRESWQRGVRRDIVL